jgi:hypothetical protein
MRAAGGLLTPNGAAVTGGGRELLVAETFASRITSFSIADDGSLTGRRVWAELAPAPPTNDLRSCLRALRVAPDGLTANAAGHVWFADAAGGGCVRISPGGAVLDRVEPRPRRDHAAAVLRSGCDRGTPDRGGRGRSGYGRGRCHGPVALMTPPRHLFHFSSDETIVVSDGMKRYG